MQALADSDTVVEAIREDEAVKCTAFSLLDTVRSFLQSPLSSEACPELAQHHLQSYSC